MSADAPAFVAAGPSGAGGGSGPGGAEGQPRLKYLSSGELVAAARHFVTMRPGRFESGSILRLRRATATSTLRSSRLCRHRPAIDLQQLIARQHCVHARSTNARNKPNSPVGKGDVLAHWIGTRRHVAGEVRVWWQPANWRMRFGFVRFRLRRQRFRDLREQASLVRKIDDIRRGRPLGVRRRHDEHPADLGSHRLDRGRVYQRRRSHPPATIRQRDPPRSPARRCHALDFRRPPGGSRRRSGAAQGAPASPRPGR